MITIVTKDGRTVTHEKGIVVARFWRKIEAEREAVQKIANAVHGNGK